MEWQTGVVLLIVAVAVCYLGRRAWRTWRGGKTGCGGGCGSGCKIPAANNAQPSLIPPGQLTLRRPGPGRSL